MSTSFEPKTASPHEVNVYVRRIFDNANREALSSHGGGKLRIDLPGDLPDGLSVDRLKAELLLQGRRQPSMQVVFSDLTLGINPKAEFIVR